MFSKNGCRILSPKKLIRASRRELPLMSKMQKMLLAGALVAGLAGGLVAFRLQRPYVEASRSFVVQNKRHAASTVYDYEGYYTLQTADEAAKSLASWVASPG